LNKEYFSIGEISKIKGITMKALRFYDRIGLLKPTYTDPDSKYRYYHLSQFVYLDIIKAARTMDISPNDLIPFFKSRDSKSLLDFLDMHKEKTRRKIDALADIIRGIEEVEKSIDRAEKAAREDAVYLRRLPDRYAVTAPFDQNKPMEEYIFDFSELYLTANMHGLVSTYEEGLLFSQNDRGEPYPESLCVFVAGVKNGYDCRLIPGGDHFCVCYTKEKAVGQQQKLWDYLQKHKLNPFNLVQVGLLTDLLAEETTLLEMQARV
jgi:DNA-binding transcriptional MerR regulator